MVKPLLLALLLTVVQKEAKPPATGIIVGAVTVPEDTTLSQRLQVVLMSQKYLELWNAEVQRRLDGYWERFKPTFAQQREIFVAATERAYIESTQSVILRMRRELSATIGDFLQDSSPEGRFEFKNVPLG